MKIVVIGATSGIAEHCCRLWAAEDAADFVLMARDTAKLEKIAADLEVRGARSISLAQPEFLDPAAIKAFADATVAAGPVDLVLIAHGWMPDQQGCQDDLALCRETLEVNAVSPVLFAEAFAAPFARAGRGTIAIIGSVAGDRGRKANYTYGACKGFIGALRRGHAASFRRQRREDRADQARPDRHADDRCQKGAGQEAGPGRPGRARDGERHPRRAADGLHAADLVADHADRPPHPALRVHPAVDLRRKRSCLRTRASRSLMIERIHMRV